MSTAAKTGRNKLALTLVLFFSFSCAQVVKVHTPAAMFMSAETAGKLLGGNFFLNLQSGTQGTLYLTSDDQVDGPMKLSNAVTPLGLGLDVGLIEKVDIYHRSPIHESPGTTGIKVQILGDSKASAQSGNHSLAFAMGAGSASSTVESDNLFDGDDSADFEADSRQKLQEVAALYSYRTDDDTLVYSNLRVAKHSLEADIRDDNNSSLDGKKVDVETDALTLSAGITRYFSNTFASLEASLQRTDWTNNDATTFGMIGAAVGWSWK